MSISCMFLIFVDLKTEREGERERERETVAILAQVSCLSFLFREEDTLAPAHLALGG